jgi:hypothetical protein
LLPWHSCHGDEGKLARSTVDPDHYSIPVIQQQPCFFCELGEFGLPCEGHFGFVDFDLRRDALEIIADLDRTFLT